MTFFVRNALALQVFALLAAFSWIHGGTRPDLLLPVIPWLAAFVLEMALVFPQAKSTETLSEARLRVWKSLVRDPLLYLALAQAALLVIPLFNVAGPPVLDPATGKWAAPVPPHPALPFCTAADEHATLLLWFPPVMIAALAVRHGLLKRGKRILFEMMCWNGALLSLFGFLQWATGATSVFWGAEKFSDFFSTFGYPNIAGAFFTLLFALSAGLWCAHAADEKFGPAVTASLAFIPEEKTWWDAHRMFLPTLLNFFGAIATLSRAAILLSAVVLAVLGIYAAAGLWQKASTGGRVLIGVSLSGVLLALILGTTVFAPAALKKELDTLSVDAVVTRVSGRGQYHARVAGEIFKDHPVFGVGGWGYPHYQHLYMTDEELKSKQIVGGVNVHNDSLQFLAEQGWTGFGLLLLCSLAAIIPAVVPMFGRRRESAATSQPVPSPRFLYCQSPVSIAVPVGCLATVVHSFGDLPFRDPAVLLVWFLAFACAPGFIPAVKHRGGRSRHSGQGQAQAVSAKPRA